MQSKCAYPAISCKKSCILVQDTCKTEGMKKTCKTGKLTKICKIEKLFCMTCKSLDLATKNLFCARLVQVLQDNF